MNEDAVKSVRPLTMPWATQDPFLFSVHHLDAYPSGNDKLGPAASLAGRNLGMDFEGRDGWRMYHGEVVPGFPQHPHRGFETVTIVRSGYIDHSDSLGAAARFGPGDVQWLTAGRGVVHAEMFPLLERERPNPVELFQIWLNLPAASKMVEPHFSMLWSADIRTHRAEGVEVTVVAGALEGTTAPAPPPHSWASRPDSNVAIWLIKLAPGARWTLPHAARGTNRSLYFHHGSVVKVDGREVRVGHGVELRPEHDVKLENGAVAADLVLLQGHPIGEPVVQHGPFVMNSRAEIQQAMSDYQRTRFGGWPWPSDDPVHARTESRFARHPDGRMERVP